MKIKKGDNVQIMVGKESGKRGKIAMVDRKGDKVLIDGLNIFKKHKRPAKEGEKGEIVPIARPLNAANVMLVCPSCNKPVRIGYKVEGDKKIRYCKKCKGAV